MFLKDFLESTSNLFAPVSETPDLDARLLLMHVLNCDTTFMFREPNYVLPDEILESLQILVARRKAGEPIAYILGKQGFWDFELKVTPDTLIPRPDTECLVEYILGHFNESPRKVLDLGTGTGAIAIALQRIRPDWRITAVDKSKPTLDIAIENAKILSADQIQFIESSWFEQVGAHDYDLIISNPPYIATCDPALTQLQFEPHFALVADDEGYADLAHIIQKAPEYLIKQGVLILEHGASQREGLMEILASHGYDIAHKGDDYAGKARFLVANCAK